MVNYKIVNPFIEGDFDSTVDGNTAIDAASEAWNKISEHISNNVPSFAFTLQKVKGGSLHHFIVQENLLEGGQVDFKISPLKLKLKKKELEQFKKSINKLEKQSGGKRKKRYKDDDDDDEFDDAFFELFKFFLL
jgi:hypothetical protein